MKILTIYADICRLVGFNRWNNVFERIILAKKYCQKTIT